MDNQLILYFLGEEIAPSGNVFLAQRMVDLLEEGHCLKITVEKFEIVEVPKELR